MVCVCMKRNAVKTTGLALLSLGLAVVTVGQVFGFAQKEGRVLGLSTQLAQVLPNTGTSFLPSGSADGASGLSPLFQVNIPAVFTDTATLLSLIVEEESVFNGQARFVDEVILENGAQLLGNLDANGIDIDVGTGEITASNLVYSVIAGSGITVSGDQDLTITNADRGSAQKIFSKVKVGSDTAEAGSNTDTFEFSAGDGISLSLNTSDKKMTLTASNLSGWYKASSSNVALITSTNRVGIGTSSPSNKLEVDSGTDGETGITFTRVTSSTAAGVGGGKVLSVDSGGKLILVEDQTGGGGAATPSAEAVLPSATSGMTIYYNGTNWVSSNNLYHDGGSVGISTTNPLSRFQVNSNLASKIGAIFRGYTSQTANLTEWQDVSGNVLSYIDANGVFNGTANVSGSLNPGLTTGSVLFQDANGIAQDNANLFWDNSTNRLGIGTSGPTAQLEILEPDATTKGLRIKAAGAASANLFEVVDAGNVPIFVVSRTAGSGAYGASITNAAATETLLLSSDQVIQANSLGINFTTKAIQSYNSQPLTLNPAGNNVSIGTTTATGLLTLPWSSTTNRIVFDHSSGQNAYIGGANGVGIGQGLGLYGPGGISFAANTANGGPYSTFNHPLRITSGYPFQNIPFQVTGSNHSILATFMGGNVGVGTTSPTAFMHITGGYGANDALTINQTLSGNILSASASGATKFVITNGGNVGIGTTNPGTYKLNVVGNIVANNTGDGGKLSSTRDGSYEIYLKTTNGDTSLLHTQAGFWIEEPNAFKILSYNSSIAQPIITLNENSQNFDTWIKGTTGTLLYGDASTGNVGVGTTIPNKKLDVSVGSLSLDQQGGMLLSGNAGSTIAYLGTYMDFDNSSDNAYGYLRMARTSGSTFVGMELGADTRDGLRFLTGDNSGDGTATERMRITAAGNVGIGETNPQAQLHVGPNNDGHVRHSNGTIDVRWDYVSRVYLSQNLGVEGSFGYNSGGIRVSGQAANEYGYILGGRTAWGASGYDLIFNPGSTGSVGVGNYAPNARLHVAGFGTTTGAVFNATDLNYVSALYVRENGTIGMGTTSPTARLHINGGYGANDALTINQTLGGNIMSASASGTTKMVLTNAGRLGVNNSLAYYMVDVTATADGTDNGAALALKGTSYSTHGGYMILNKNTGDDTPGLIQVGDNSIHLPLLLNPGGGNVAIGTTTASYKLDVNGEIRSNNIIRVTGNDGGFYATPRWGGTYSFLWYNQDGNAMRLYSNQDVFSISYNGNVGVGTNTYGDTAANTIAIYNSTAPTTSLTNGIQLFAVDVTGSHELQVRDEAGNVTTLSPHNFSLLDNQRSEDLAWAFYSERNGLAINADMTKALRVVEKLSGEQLIRIKNLTNGEDLTDFYADQSSQELALDNAEWITRAELNPFMTWGSNVLTIIGKTIFEKPTEFLAEVTFKARVTFSEPDKAGVAVLKAGSTTVTVNFEVPFKQTPVITLTPQNSFAKVTVKDVTPTGFVVFLAETQPSDTEVVWSTISVEQLKRTENTPTEAPTQAQQQPTPSASPNPSPTAVDSSSPSPELMPTPTTATISASPDLDAQ